MSFVSLIVPAFHLNSKELSEIKEQCSSEFDLPEDSFEIIEIRDGTNNNNYGIIFNESSLSLSSIEELIYEKNCIQTLCEKTFESLQIITKKINDLDHLINSFNEFNQNNNLKKSLLNNKSDSNINCNNNKIKDCPDNSGNNIKITLKNIKIEFKTMVKELEILNKNVSDNKSYSIKSDKIFSLYDIPAKVFYQNDERFCFSNNNIYHYKLENTD